MDKSTVSWLLIHDVYTWIFQYRYCELSGNTTA